jgi:hypothetical protein
MLDRFRASVFGWSVRPPEAKGPAEPPEPPVHPEQRFLRAVNAPSFIELRRDAERRMERHEAPGRVETVRGVTRAKSYSSALQAGADYAVAEVEFDVGAAERVLDERRGELPSDPTRIAFAEAVVEREKARCVIAQRYAALATRWELRTRLDALNAMPVRENASWGENRAAAPTPSPTPVPWDHDIDAAVRNLRARRGLASDSPNGNRPRSMGCGESM